MGFMTDLRARLARRAPRAPDPPGVTVPAWLVRAGYFASWVAMAVLVYFLWLYTLDIARDRAGALQVSHVGTWVGGPISFWFPYIVGFGVLAFGIPYVAKIAIPTFMSLSWRGQFWPKAWALFIALAVSAVVIAGTFSVQGETLMERERDAAVAVAGVAQNRARTEARIADIDARLEQMRDRTRNNEYAATAANVGAEAYRRSYMSEAALARSPPARRDIIVRALGAAEAADALEAERRALRDQLAAAPVAESVQRRVETERTSWIAATLDGVQGVRAILLALVMDIVCLMMPWIALRLEQARNAQLAAARSAPMDDDHMIEDLRAEAPIASEPMEPVKEAMFDALTGEELVKRRAHWAKKPKRKGRAEPVTLAPEAPQPDERQGPMSASDERLARPPAPTAEAAPEPPETQGEAVPTPEEIDDELAAAIAADAEAAPEPAPEPVADVVALPDGEGVMQQDRAEPDEAPGDEGDDEGADARQPVAAE